MTDEHIIIEDCPYFVNGVCMEYLDGACENHKCDLKIIRELEQKLIRKEQECERLKEANKHIEYNRTQKANKLKRIEEMIIACSSGYTDEFIQSILAIILEAEPIKE